MVAILEAHRREEITQAVQAMYTAVARVPDTGFHFPVGASAATLVGYSNDLLDPLPQPVLAAFAGVGCPFEAGVIRAGDIVLDVGSGSGADALIASAMVGPAGRVIALDLTYAMLERLTRTATAAGIDNVEALHCDAEAIPLPDASIDVVTSNGALNLVPDKPRAFAEIFRVLRAGGRLQLADVVLGNPVTDSCRADPRLWVECVVGATLEPVLFELLSNAGFHDIEVIRRIDYFAASSSAETRAIAAALNAQAIVLRARPRDAPPPVGAPTDGPTREGGGATHRSQMIMAPPAPAAGEFMPQPDEVLEAYGQTCISLEPLIKAHLRAMQSGQVLEVRADDPTARLGVPSWCRLSGNTLLAMITQEFGRTRFFLRRK
ncbi:MAG: methyltransferase domain-containing protein [Longimicrobiales bacterium]